MCYRVGAHLEVPLLGSFFQEEQGGVGHAKGENDFICMNMISSLQAPHHSDQQLVRCSAQHAPDMLNQGSKGKDPFRSC